MWNLVESSDEVADCSKLYTLGHCVKVRWRALWKRLFVVCGNHGTLAVRFLVTKTGHFKPKHVFLTLTKMLFCLNPTRA